MSSSDQVRSYTRAESVVFLKTNELFGGLSNMAAGYPLRVNGIRILTSEALYQSCRFPHLPDVQRMIIGENSPMTAKMRSKPYRQDSRPDWDRIRVRVMRWCLRMKLASNWSTFSELLLKTGDRPIVEQSRKDDFWGAKAAGDGSRLVGMNVLGRLLMELREQVKEYGRDAFLRIETPGIPDFQLLCRPIEVWALKSAHDVTGDARTPQAALFGDDLSIDRKVTSDLASVIATSAEYAQPASVVPFQVKEETKLTAQAGPAAVNDKGHAYPSYRESGLSWVPQIPEGWQVLRNGRLFSHRVETGYPDLPILEVSLRTGVRVRDMVNGKRKQVMSAKEKYKRAVKGDIAYNMMRMWQGAVGPAPVDGLVSPAYVVVKPHEGVSSAYFSYLFSTAAYMQEVNKFSRGIVADRNRLYWETFKQMPSLMPPEAEQDQIVAYLRAQDAQIARFIKAKRDLIALLTEQRLRVIHEAVTCGIDVTGEQKYSEVEWIGNIPAHWVVAALNSRYRIDLGKMLDESSITGEHLIPYLRNQDVQWGHVRTKSLPEMDIRPNEVARYTLQKGDLLVCEGGDIGRSAFWDGSVSPCGYQKALHRVRPRSSGQDEPRYLYYLLYLASKRGIFIADGSINTIAHLTAEKLRRHRFCFPPYEEQKKISEWLDSSLVYIEKAISSATEEIDLIREYRNKVVADVVTGQIDVRAWQPGPEDLITEEDLTALGGDDDIDTTEEETDGDD